MPDVRRDQLESRKPFQKHLPDQGMVGLLPVVVFIERFEPPFRSRQGDDAQFVQAGRGTDVANLIFRELHPLRDEYGHGSDTFCMAAVIGLMQLDDRRQKPFGGVETPASSSTMVDIWAFFSSSCLLRSVISLRLIPSRRLSVCNSSLRAATFL